MVAGMQRKSLSRWRFRLSLIAVGVLLAAGCATDDDSALPSTTDDAPSTVTNPVGLAPAPFTGYSSEVYADPSTWLCRPDAEDVCDTNLDAEVIEADGTRTTEVFEQAADPPVDCFYVYPTVSSDPGANSDLEPGGGEATAVLSQVARLAGSCRVWAPMYNQATLSTISGAINDEGTTSDEGEEAGTAERDAAGNPPVDENSPFNVAYASARDAFRHYMANDNGGRGVVLVGHSQGTGVLRQLITDEFDPNPAMREQLVSAVLMGLSIPENPSSGGFANIPVCTSDTQTGCYLSWSSYRSTAPPEPGAYFGAPSPDGSRAACTNPADLSGSLGAVRATPYFADTQSPQGVGWIQSRAGEQPTEPWVALPGLIEVACVERNGYHYLEVTVVPDEVRTPDVPGDLTAPWGLHLVDANLVMGELVGIIASQAEAWVSGR